MMIVQKIWDDLRHLPCLTAIIALKIIQITLVIVSVRYLAIIKVSNFGILLTIVCVWLSRKNLALVFW